MTKGHAGAPQADSLTCFSRHALPPAGTIRINYNLPLCTRFSLFPKSIILIIYALISPVLPGVILFKELFMAKKTAIDKLGWGINVILTLFLDPIIQGINRILRGKVIVGILWIITVGLFGIGWLIDFITVLVYKDIKFLA
jgi:tryptophan-rich sensory protein